MALIDELKEQRASYADRKERAVMDVTYLDGCIEDLDIAIAALEPPAPAPSAHDGGEESGEPHVIGYFISEGNSVELRSDGSTAPLIDAQTCEVVDPRVEGASDEPDALAEFMKLPGAVKWEGGGYPAFCQKYPNRETMEIVVLFRNGERVRGVPAGFAWSTAEELRGSGWRDEDAVGGKIPDADDIIAYRIITTQAEPALRYMDEGEQQVMQDALWASAKVIEREPAPEQDASEIIDNLAAKLVDGLTLSDDTVAVHTYMDGDQVVMREISAEEMYAQPDPSPYNAAVESGAITQDEADFLVSERERIAADEQAKFFARGMMADADRHQSDQRGIVGALAGMFKQKEPA